MENITNDTITDLHAIITCHKDIGDDYEKIKENDLSVRLHSGESDYQYKKGIIRMEFISNDMNVEANVHVDAIMSFIFTAYGATIKKRFLGIYNHIKVRLLSYLIKKFK